MSIFISDFHAARFHAAMDWAFGLAPSTDYSGPDAVVSHHVTSVSSVGVDWGSQDEYKARLAHEEKGAGMLRHNAETGVATTVTEMAAYLLLGGHMGYHKFTHDTYVPTEGGGWGGKVTTSAGGT